MNASFLHHAFDSSFPENLDPKSIAYLNGEFLALENAKVSALDRGFLFADGIYEVVPVYRRKPFLWSNHLRRLVRSLSAIQLPSPLRDEDWTELVRQMIEHQAFDDQFIYLQITRGSAKRDHAFPKKVRPTVFAMATEFKRPSQVDRENGLKAITVGDERWLRCDIKSVALLGNVLARQQAVDQDAHEAILIRGDVVTEGASSNIWLVVDDELLGHPKDNLALEGIRYSLIEELAISCGLRLSLRKRSPADLARASEVLLSSATKELLAITSINQKPVGQGRPGPVFHQLREAYDRAIDMECPKAELSEAGSSAG
ncbi:MAG: D-amino acid aminotransferase [Burkholderiaceae bacterium]